MPRIVASVNAIKAEAHRAICPVGDLHRNGSAIDKCERLSKYKLCAAETTFGRDVDNSDIAFHTHGSTIVRLQLHIRRREQLRDSIHRNTIFARNLCAHSQNDREEDRDQKAAIFNHLNILPRTKLILEMLCMLLPKVALLVASICARHKRVTDGNGLVRYADGEELGRFLGINGKFKQASPLDTFGSCKEWSLQSSIREHGIISRRKRVFKVERQTTVRPRAGEQHSTTLLGGTEDGQRQRSRLGDRNNIRQNR